MAFSSLASTCFGSNLLNPISPFFSCAPSILCRSISTSNNSITVETSVLFTAYNCVTPSRSIDTSATKLLSFFRDMAVMRCMEITTDSLYKAKLIHGFCHLYDGQEVINVGQEAVNVGMESTITKKDYIITSHNVLDTNPLEKHTLFGMA